MASKANQPAGVKAAPRSYDSPLRTRLADETRRAVLAAARDLFVAKGWAATSIDEIAETAGVSKPTVFSSVGNKRDLLKAVRDIALAGDDAPRPVAERAGFRTILESSDPRTKLRLLARHVARTHARYAEIEEVLRAAAGADQEIAELWKTNEQERRRAAAVVVRSMRGEDLRAEPDGVVEVLWALMASDNYRRLVLDAGWSDERYAAWLADALCALLLARPGTRKPF